MKIIQNKVNFRQTVQIFNLNLLLERIVPLNPAENEKNRQLHLVSKTYLKISVALLVQKLLASKVNVQNKIFPDRVKNFHLHFTTGKSHSREYGFSDIYKILNIDVSSLKIQTCYVINLKGKTTSFIITKALPYKDFFEYNGMYLTITSLNTHYIQMCLWHLRGKTCNV